MNARFFAASFAVASALIIAPVAPSAVAPVASAAPVIGLPNHAAVNQLNPDQLITLTLNYPRPHNPYNPLLQGQRSADQLAGIRFRFEKVTSINLATVGGWEAARSINSVDDVPSSELEYVTTATTNSSGTLSVTLPMGVYLVTELPNDNNFATVDPFFVALPVGDLTTGTWRYDVTMTPKIELSPSPFNTSVPPTTPKNPPTEPGTPPTEPGNPPTEPGNPPTEPGTSTTEISTPNNPPAVPPTTPGVPNIPGVTGTPGTTSHPGRSWLPNTGAGVLGLMGVGFALVALGIALVTRRQQNRENTPHSSESGKEQL